MKTLFLLVLFISVNLLASTVATITAIKGKAKIQRESQSINAIIGFKLKEKDTIITQDNTKLQLIFQDETIISLGKNTHFSIEEYLFEDSTEPVAKFGMFKGAIRTITGKIGKIAPDKFSVNTKTATIGIRGTNFTTIVKEESFDVYCTYGAISVTINGEVYIVNQGYYLHIDSHGKVSIQEFNADTLKKMRQENFGLVHKKVREIVKGDIETELQNEEHLNVTIPNTMDITIQEITETYTENILNPGADVITDGGIIAEYSMNHANYLGSYTTILNTTSLPGSGDAKLSINFAENKGLLELGNFSNDTATLYYDINNINSSTFSGTLSGGKGDTNGGFYGPAGNTVKGNFSYQEDSTTNKANTAEGSYNVISTQKLY